VPPTDQVEYSSLVVLRDDSKVLVAPHEPGARQRAAAAAAHVAVAAAAAVAEAAVVLPGLFVRVVRAAVLEAARRQWY
jgi:hypothetical protein